MWLCKSLILRNFHSIHSLVYLYAVSVFLISNIQHHFLGLKFSISIDTAMYSRRCVSFFHAMQFSMCEHLRCGTEFCTKNCNIFFFSNIFIFFFSLSINLPDRHMRTGIETHLEANQSYVCLFYIIKSFLRLI